MSPSPGSTEPIVVGVDGSPSSLAALQWAGAQARLTGAALQAVTTWEYPTEYAGFGFASAIPEDIDFEKDARDALSAAVAEALPDQAGLTLTESTLEGHAALVLTDLSESAALLVVGCRGHGGFTGLLLGSVSAHLAAHAHCPVVVVHEHEHAPDR